MARPSGCDTPPLPARLPSKRHSIEAAPAIAIRDAPRRHRAPRGRSGACPDRHTHPCHPTGGTWFGRSIDRRLPMRWAVSNAGSGERLGESVDRLQGEVAELRRSRRRLAEAAHADRRAIERAIHDGIQQHLVAIAIDLRHLAGLVDDDPAAAKLLLVEMAANMRIALDEATQLAHRQWRTERCQKQSGRSSAQGMSSGERTGPPGRSCSSCRPGWPRGPEQTTRVECATRQVRTRRLARRSRHPRFVAHSTGVLTVAATLWAVIDPLSCVAPAIR